MNKIKLLDELTINKIAAGEVIERPISVVKELVENSIDAKSDEIIIRLIDGGKKQISVIDNGEGMSKEDLLICTKKHATSKMFKIEDIFSVSSYGFRGEALATVSSVSKMEIISAQESSETSNKLIIENGKVKEIVPETKRKGTAINVYNLFYTIPARQKFLKTSGYELKQIVDWLKSIAISNPKIYFKVYSENKQLLDLKPVENYGERIKQIFGLELLNNSYKDPVVDCTCYFSKPSDVKDLIGHRQIYYINDRPIRSQKIFFAILKAYETKIPKGKKPHVFVFLKIDPKVVDINVHPQKLEVRVKNENILFIPVYKSIIEGLEKGFNSEINTEQDNYFKNAKLIETLSKKINERVEKSVSHDVFETPPLVFNEQTKLAESRPSEITREQGKQKYKLIGQYSDTYILVEDINGSLLIIDQHVAEERYNFEKLSEQYKNKKISVQTLISPIPLEFDRVDLILIEEKQEILKKFGIDFTLFDDVTIMLRAIPIVMERIPGREDLKQMILEIINDLKSSKKEDMENKILASLSCKASVKADTPLNDMTMRTIIDKLFQTKNPYTCPHGRPVFVELTKKEIEKKVGRI
jgi:DNA mismatch repair protein MutL